MTSRSRYSVRFLASISMVATAIGLAVPGTETAAGPPNVASQSDPQTLLFVQTKPEGAEIRLEGKVLGRSDGLFAVEPGTYKIVIDLGGHPPREQQITVRKGRIARIEMVFDKAVSSDSKQSSRPAAPCVVAMNPPAGATEVDPQLQYITVAFDQAMSSGYSFTGGGPEYPEIPEGKGPVWKDRQTCVLPVRLQAGRYYRVGINSTSYQNFRSSAGLPAPPSAIFFTTRGASEELKNQVRIPGIVSIVPANGAADVDPKLNEILVTFDMPMGAGCSWTGSGPRFPEIPQGKSPTWSEDGKTCVLPVQLKPDWDYFLGLNSVSHKNFQSKWGVPLEPVPYHFSTRAE
ncbi:MAG: PEGA domain-containing protein [Rhodopirellula sp.]|nr:PEGA domain-containing protein [Rhodopirellula sp.]